MQWSQGMPESMDCLPNRLEHLRNWIVVLLAAALAILLLSQSIPQGHQLLEGHLLEHQLFGLLACTGHLSLEYGLQIFTLLPWEDQSLSCFS